ncbi:hypothetical protein E1293_34725 [Actinomadura darangshiensis]|uniref:Uncharacterized protein n=1 Tax=Actinomadura darangshiensis TaxID=705336 RepID=A0A4R5AKJ3_9ACTN|nr:hypothetical protein [Actinomadura darangshiensis]TDD70572.1 hypothetical protein E1293_34725 [Actinomadura darangshiensis]
MGRAPAASAPAACFSKPAEEVPLDTAPVGRSAEIRGVAAALTGIAQRVASLDRALDRALRERTHAVAFVPARRHAAARALARLRAIDRAKDGIYEIDVDFSHELIEALSLISFRLDVLGGALVHVPSYDFPVDRSETRGWMRLIGRELGLDIGLVSRVDPDAIRRLHRDLAEAVEKAQVRVGMLLEDSP